MKELKPWQEKAIGILALALLLLIVVYLISLAFHGTPIKKSETQMIVPFGDGWLARIHVPIEFDFIDNETGELFGTLKIQIKGIGLQIYFNDRPIMFIPKGEKK